MLVPNILTRVAASASTQMTNDDAADLIEYVKGVVPSVLKLTHCSPEAKEDAIQDALMRVITDKPDTPDEVERVIQRALEQSQETEIERAQNWPTESYDIEYGDEDSLTDYQPAGRVLVGSEFVSDQQQPFDVYAVQYMFTLCRSNAERQLITLVLSLPSDMRPGAFKQAIIDAREEVGMSLDDLRAFGRRVLSRYQTAWQATWKTRPRPKSLLSELEKEDEARAKNAKSSAPRK